MKCKDINKLFPLYLDNKLSDKELSLFKEHLNSCKSCSALYVKINSSLDLLKPTKDIPEQAFYYTRLKQKMENDLAKKESPLSILLSKKILQPIMYLSSIILAVYIGILIGSGSVKQNTYSQSLDNEESYIESFAQYQYFNDLEIETIENIILSDTIDVNE